MQLYQASPPFFIIIYPRHEEYEEYCDVYLLGRKLKTTMEAFQEFQKQCSQIKRITPNGMD